MCSSTPQESSIDQADLVEENKKLRRENEQLRDEVEELHDRLDDHDDQLEEHDDQLEEHDDQLDDQDARLDALGTGLSTAHEEIEAVEADVEASEPHPSDGQDTTPNTSIEPETPLESVTSLPEPMAETELTANQQRARFVAKDVESYTRRVPAGRAIKSSEIATVLRAGTECDGRSQTVSRVIRFLEDLGGDDVEIVERRGERRVVFSDELASRLKRLTSSRGDSNAVVAEVST